MTVKSGRDSLIIKDILMGEVWLASGQSNMEMPIKGFKSEGPVDSAGEEIPNAKFPEIRMFTVGRKIAFASGKKCLGNGRLVPQKQLETSLQLVIFLVKNYTLN